MVTYAPDAATDELSQLLARLKPKPLVEVAPAACSELSGAEVECVGGMHYTGPRTVSRSCPEAQRAAVRSRIPAEATRLAGLLKKAGYERMGPTDQRDIGRVLRHCLQPRPEVEGLSTMLRMLDVCASKPLERNVMLQGALGLGKTTAQLCLYFSQLQLGVSSRFLTSSDLRAVAVRRASADQETADEAERQLQLWQRARVLVWSDIGDKDEHDRNFRPTVQDLLENFGGVLLGSTNLGQEELAAHPNIGPRAADRMFADHNTMPAICIELKGPSQRARR
jgi:hypothetical protein